MTVTGIRAYAFSIPFAAPVRVGNRVLEERKGLLIRVEDGSGRFGWGEIAPLPGLDDDTLEDCKDDLRKLAGRIRKAGAIDASSQGSFQASACEALSGATPPEEISHVGPQPDAEQIAALDAAPDAAPDAPWRDARFRPAVQFGLDSAVLALVTGAGRNPVHKPGDPLAATINGLFIPEPDMTIVRRQANRIVASGVSTVKVKIGRIPLEAESAAIRYLYGRCGGNVTFRLDANRSFHPDRYRAYYRQLSDLPVEYVEEPLENADFHSAAAVGWPLAVDESLPSYWNKKAGRPENLPDAVSRIIVKPATPVGFSNMMRFFSGSRAGSLLPVLSSAYNTVYGISSLLLHLKHVPGAAAIAHGLDTGAFLQYDLVGSPPVIQNGRITAPDHILWEKDQPDSGLTEEVRL